jgi:hypothetical protein
MEVAMTRFAAPVRIRTPHRRRRGLVLGPLEELVRRLAAQSEQERRKPSAVRASW